MKNLFLILILFLSHTIYAQQKEQTMKPEVTEFWEPKVPVVTSGKNYAPPSDAIVLFDGANLNQWITAKDSTAANWTINTDGSMTVKNKTGNIKTKQNFGSVQLHLEWKSPTKIQGTGQGRGNSGVFLQSRYEVQVLDNNNNDTYVNGQVGSVYKQSVPLAMASVKTGDWNTYDIIFHEPEFDAGGNIINQATITVFHNGILIQDHFKIIGPTAYIGYPKYEKHDKAPLLLQNHGDSVSYRNIWLRELN